MTSCQICGTENLQGSQYCDECGALLDGGAENNRQIEPSTLHRQISENPIFQSTSVTSVGIPAVGFESEMKEKSFARDEKSKPAHAALIIERGDASGIEFPLVPDEIDIGRWDADNGIFPDVDLDRCDPEAKISRRHARIIRRNDKYTIEDLGSTNGTFVNRGRRLIPGNKNVLNDGDEVIVGKTFLRFYVNE